MVNGIRLVRDEMPLLDYPNVVKEGGNADRKACGDQQDLSVD